MDSFMGFTINAGQSEAEGSGGRRPFAKPRAVMTWLRICEEIGFPAIFDGAVRKVLDIVDMPDRRASLLVRLILQNKGRLSDSKRSLFAEISEDELHDIEKVVWRKWEEEHAKRGAAQGAKTCG